MAAIELLYAENVITRKRGVARQALVFTLRVRNLAYAKQVEVRWAGEDGAWVTLAAAYVGQAGDGRELWRAQTWRQFSATAGLPGNIRFACVLRSGGSETWCKAANGEDFKLQADAGLLLGPNRTLCHVGYAPRLQAEQKSLNVDVAVAAHLQAEQVFVEWSTDGWQSKQRTPCHFALDHWDKAQQSNARNPNQYGVQLWSARLRIREAYRVEYAVGCVTPQGEVWDNNGGSNYSARHAELKVLTLNLHCYQEDNQDFKLSQVARAINELDIDLVCLQEVAENWNDGQGDWNSNAAKIILERLDRPYHLHTDWAHRGFDRYREGVAVLSKHSLLKRDARYVSPSQDAYDIHARKAVMVQVEIPFFGRLNVFSAHLSWWKDGFKTQFDTLAHWARQAHTRAVAATLLCGDFNIAAGSEGYLHVVGSSDFEDQYLKSCCRPLFDDVRRQAPGWPRRLAEDPRIDYIWTRRGAPLRPIEARTLFTEHAYGRVSDHMGYLVVFEAV